jgi:hypothetical protein
VVLALQPGEFSVIERLDSFGFAVPNLRLNFLDAQNECELAQPAENFQAQDGLSRPWRRNDVKPPIGGMFFHGAKNTLLIGSPRPSESKTVEDL